MLDGLFLDKGFPGGSVVKNPPVKYETQVRSLGLEDPLEKEMATCSTILAWKIPMDKGAWHTTVHEVAESQTQLRTHSHTYSRLYFLGILPL